MSRKFPLALVLRLRRTDEEREGILLATMERRVEAARKAVERTDAGRREHERSRLRRGAAVALAADQRYADRLALERSRLEAARSEVVEKAGRQRAVLLKAVQERRKLEKMEEQWQDKLRREEQRAEAIEMDEAARSQYHRRKA